MPRKPGGLNGLPIHRRGGYWICYVRDAAGKRYQRALHIRDDGTEASRRAAIAAYWQEQARATSGEYRRPRAAKTLAKALAAVLAAQELAERTAHTLNKTTDRGARLLEHYGPDFDLSTLTTRDDLVQYATAARQHRSGRTVLMELGVLRQAMAAVGLPLPPMPDIPAAPKAQEPLTDDEQRRALLAATPAHKLTLLTYLTLGLRLSEIRKIEAVDWKAQTLEVHGTKSHNAMRRVPIPDELFELMCSMRRAGTWQGFPRLGNKRLDTIIRRTCIRAGIGPRSANDLRGTVSQRLKRAGLDAEDRGAFMGNSAQMQERTYTQVKTMTEHIRRAVQKAPRITKKGDTGS